MRTATATLDAHTGQPDNAIVQIFADRVAERGAQIGRNVPNRNLLRFTLLCFTLFWSKGG